MERDEADNARQKLDDQFTSLRELIYAPDPSASSSHPAPVEGEEPADEPTGGIDHISAILAPQNDNYDQHVRELAYDKRAKPKDRTKTEEELALEEKEVLERAERSRQRRMLGLPESDSESEVGKGRKKRKRGADDLDDDFHDEIEAYENLGAGLGETVARLQDDEEEEDSSNEPSGDEGSEEEETGDEPEVEVDDENSDIGEGGHGRLVTFSTVAKGKTKDDGAKMELPFTFPCPENHDEFLEIVDDVEHVDVPTVVQRIRALYHVSFAPENKFKLQVRKVLFLVLFLFMQPCSRNLPKSLLTTLFTFHHSPHLIIRSYPLSSLTSMRSHGHTQSLLPNISTKSYHSCIRTSNVVFRVVL